MVKEFRTANFSRNMPWFVQINDVSQVENLPRSTSTLLQEWDFQLKSRYRISVMKCGFRVQIIKLNCWQVLVAFYYRHLEINTQYFKKQYFKEMTFQRSVRKSGDMGKRSTHTTHKTQQIACYFIRIYHRGRLFNWKSNSCRRVERGTWKILHMTYVTYLYKSRHIPWEIFFSKLFHHYDYITTFVFRQVLPQQTLLLNGPSDNCQYEYEKLR